MTLLRLSPESLARTSFALSPLAETMASFVALREGHPPPWLRSWHDRHQGDFADLVCDDLARGLVDLLRATRWIPDFIAPPPRGGMATSIESELAVVAATDDCQVRRDFERSAQDHASGSLPHGLAGRDLAARTAHVLDRVWSSFVAHDWPRRRAILERDVMHRAGLLGAYGWARAVDELRPGTRWVGDDAIRINDNPYPDRSVSDAGLSLVPITFPGGWLCEGEPDEYALIYPARGVGLDDAPVAGGLGRLLGRTRARILLDLERSATTSQLTAALGVSLGTVGDHLAVLRAGGLVARTRVGHEVVYRRTELGYQLCESGRSGS